MPIICFLLLGLKGFSNLGCSVTRELFLSETILKFENISFVLFGIPKKSSGNIFFEGLL
jgi:hypothetical protein